MRLGRTLAVLLLVASVGTACRPTVQVPLDGNLWPFAGGQYPFDLFVEMHYQQSYRSQEPRRLYPPEGSVPITGANYRPSAVEASRLQNPIPRTQDIARQDALFATNCAVCHGPQGDGNGRANAFFTAYKGRPAPSLKDPATVAKTDGELFYILTNGLNYNPEGPLNGMPALANLLSETDRWLLVNKMRRLQSGG
jgi:mono/diheme cytochrome c family protein